MRGAREEAAALEWPDDVAPDGYRYLGRLHADMKDIRHFVGGVTVDGVRVRLAFESDDREGWCRFFFANNVETPFPMERLRVVDVRGNDAVSFEVRGVVRYLPPRRKLS
jgi:hypothetical protein